MILSVWQDVKIQPLIDKLQPENKAEHRDFKGKTTDNSQQRTHLHLMCRVLYVCFIVDFFLRKLWKMDEDLFFSGSSLAVAETKDGWEEM